MGNEDQTKQRDRAEGDATAEKPAFSEVTADESVSGDYDFGQETGQETDAGAVSADDAQEVQSATDDSQDAASGDSDEPTPTVVDEDADQPFNPEVGADDADDDLATVESDTADDVERLDSDYVSRVLDAQYVDSVLDEPTIDDERYQRYITVPEERPENVNQLDKDMVEDFVNQLKPDNTDLQSMIDTDIPIDVSGPASVTAVMYGRQILENFVHMLSNELSGVSDYQINPETVRAGIMNGDVPSLTQYLIMRQVARTKRAQAVDEVRKMESEYITRKRAWVRETLDDLREQFARAVRDYDERMQPLTEEQRTAFFTAIENEAATMEEDAQMRLIPAARQEMCDVVIDADPTNPAMRALREYRTIRESNVQTALRSRIIDEDWYTTSQPSPVTQAPADDAPQDSAYKMLSTTAKDESPTAVAESEVAEPEPARSSEDDAPESASTDVTTNDDVATDAVATADNAAIDNDVAADNDDAVADALNDAADGGDDKAIDSEDKDEDKDADDDLFSGVTVTSRRRSKSKRSKKSAPKAAADVDDTDTPNRRKKITSPLGGKLKTADQKASAADGGGSSKATPVTAESGSGKGRAGEWVRQHKGVSLAGSALTLGLLIGVPATLVGNNADAPQTQVTESAPATTNPEADIQDEFSVGDKMEVVSKGKIVPVTIAEFEDAGAIAQNSNGDEFLVTNDQLEKWSESEDDPVDAENKESN